MILDAQLMFATAQAITGDAVSENTIDMGAYGATNFRDLGGGAPIRVFMNVTVAFNNLTTLDLELITDADPALGSPTVVAILKRIVLADLTIDTLHDLGSLPGLISQTVASERYLGLNFQVNGTNPSTGTVSAGLISDFQSSHRTA